MSESTANQPALTFDERRSLARTLMLALLKPQTDKARRIVAWLGGWDLETMEPITDMLDRAFRTAGHHVTVSYAAEECSACGRYTVHEQVDVYDEDGNHMRHEAVCDEPVHHRVDELLPGAGKCRECAASECAGCTRPGGTRLAADDQRYATCCCGRWLFGGAR